MAFVKWESTIGDMARLFALLLTQNSRRDLFPILPDPDNSIILEPCQMAQTFTSEAKMVIVSDWFASIGLSIVNLVRACSPQVPFLVVSRKHAGIDLLPVVVFRLRVMVLWLVVVLSPVRRCCTCFCVTFQICVVPIFFPIVFSYRA